MKASPGTAYNYIIKGRHPYLGDTGDTPHSLFIDELQDFRYFRGSSSWLEGTSFKNGVLILWTKQGRGLVYLNVPEWKVKALHFFAKPSTIDLRDEMTDEELHRLLEESLSKDAA